MPRAAALAAHTREHRAQLDGAAAAAAATSPSSPIVAMARGAVLALAAGTAATVASLAAALLLLCLQVHGVQVAAVRLRHCLHGQRHLAGVGVHGNDLDEDGIIGRQHVRRVLHARGRGHLAGVDQPVAIVPFERHERPVICHASNSALVNTVKLGQLVCASIIPSTTGTLRTPTTALASALQSTFGCSAALRRCFTCSDRLHAPQGILKFSSLHFQD